MPLLDIDKAIKLGEIDSRFRLVNIAAQRARELNAPKETTLPEQTHDYNKVTTNALEEIIEDKIAFSKIDEGEEANG